jgi:hypothetical protein
LKIKPPKILENVCTIIRARAIPITSSNTNSLGSLELNKGNDFLYIAGAKRNVIEMKNRSVLDGSLDKIVTIKTNKEAHVPPPGSLPKLKRVAS